MTSIILRGLALVSLASLFACTMTAETPCGAGEDCTAATGKADGQGFDWNAPVEEGDTPPFVFRTTFRLVVPHDGEPFTRGHSATYASGQSIAEGAIREDGVVYCEVQTGDHGRNDSPENGPYRVVNTYVRENQVKLVLANNPDLLDYMVCTREPGGTPTYSEIVAAFGEHVIFEELPTRENAPPVVVTPLASVSEAEFECRRLGYRAPTDSEYEQRGADWLSSMVGNDCAWTSQRHSESAWQLAARVVDGAVSLEWYEAHTQSTRDCRSICIADPPE